MQAGYDVVTQYFTSRGFAVAAVDYAGSAGYGRAYRLSLWGQWGVADSEDCVDAARYLAARGRVDGSAMAIRGSSAGGLTALNALADGESFAAAASWYGVTDLLALAATTHDFEAHYMDRLVGPLPECRARYEERSPTKRVAELRGSVLLLQGLDDLVVPPAQTEGMRDALLAQGRHCEVRFFEGEGHGFRRAETVRAALEEELGFLPAGHGGSGKLVEVSGYLWPGWVRYVRLWAAHVSHTSFDRWRVTRVEAGAGALPGHQSRDR